MLIQERLDRLDWGTLLFEARRAGEAIGEERGIAIAEERDIAIGVAQGMEKFAKLILKLQSLGRNDDAQKALSDTNYRTNLLKEFGML